MTAALIILGWLTCSALSHGMLFAYFQREYPRKAKEMFREDMSMSLMVSLLGPPALFCALACTGFAKHGFKFK